MTGPVVVTGASGFIGRALTARLAAAGRPTIGLGRDAFAAGGGSLQRSIAGADCVVHLAARAHRGGSAEAFEADVELTQSLARLAASSGVRRFVHMSSIGVLGTSTHGTAFTEGTTPSPAEPYAHAKLRAEQALQAGLSPTETDWVILRPSMVYGPAAPGNFARLVHAVQRGWPLPFASVRNHRCFTGIDNLLDAVELCIDHPAAAYQTFLIADAEPIATAQLVSLIAQGLKTNANLWPVPAVLLHAAAIATGRRRMADSLLGDLEIDCGHIRRSLGWRPRVAASEGIVQAARSNHP